MAESITLNIDTSDAEEALQALRNVKYGAREAIARALNRTAGEIKVAASEEASAVFTVSEETVKARMSVKRATPSGLSVTVRRKGPRWKASRFPMIDNENPGVKGGKEGGIRPYRSGSRIMLGAEGKLSKAFMVRGVKKEIKRGVGLYRRIGNHRDRITHARGLSVPDMLSDYQVRSAVEQRAQARLALEVDREIRELLEKSGAE